MTSETLTEIRRLSVSERIQLVEDIWDTIAADADGTALTNPQQEELERRLLAFQEAPETGSSWDEVKKRIVGR